ncbi:NADPH-dependent F420 reductase [Mycobacterium sp. TJFP1]
MVEISFIGAGEMTEVLGRRLLASGHDVMIGSRDLARARDLAEQIGGAKCGNYRQAASFGEIVVVALHNRVVIPAVRKLAEQLTGKIVVDCNNPVDPPDFENRYGGTFSLAEAMSQEAPGARVVKAFNTIYAEVLQGGRLQDDVPVSLFLAGDDTKAKQAVAALGDDLGYPGVDVGGLRAARHLENLAAFEIHMAFAREIAPYVSLTLVAGIDKPRDTGVASPTATD